MNRDKLFIRHKDYNEWQLIYEPSQYFEVLQIICITFRSKRKKAMLNMYRYLNIRLSLWP